MYTQSHNCLKPSRRLYWCLCITAVESNAVNPGTRSAKYAAKMAAVDSKRPTATSTIRSKDSPLIGGKSYLINWTATSTKHSNNSFSSINIDINPMCPSSSSSKVATCYHLAIWEPVCNLNSIKTTSRSNKNALNNCTTIITKFIEGSTTSASECTTWKLATRLYGCTVIKSNKLSDNYYFCLQPLITS